MANTYSFKTTRTNRLFQLQSIAHMGNKCNNINHYNTNFLLIIRNFFLYIISWYIYLNTIQNKLSFTKTKKKHLLRILNNNYFYNKKKKKKALYTQVSDLLSIIIYFLFTKCRIYNNIKLRITYIYIIFSHHFIFVYLFTINIL